MALPAAARAALIAPWVDPPDGAFLVIGSGARRSAPNMRVSGRGKPLAKLTPLSACFDRTRWRALAGPLKAAGGALSVEDLASFRAHVPSRW